MMVDVSVAKKQDVLTLYALVRASTLNHPQIANMAIKSRDPTHQVEVDFERLSVRSNLKFNSLGCR